MLPLARDAGIGANRARRRLERHADPRARSVEDRGPVDGRHARRTRALPAGRHRRDPQQSAGAGGRAIGRGEQSPDGPCWPSRRFRSARPAPTKSADSSRFPAPIRSGRRRCARCSWTSRRSSAIRASAGSWSFTSTARRSHIRAIDDAGDFFHDTYGGRMVNLWDLVPVISGWGNAMVCGDDRRGKEGRRRLAARRDGRAQPDPASQAGARLARLQERAGRQRPDDAGELRRGEEARLAGLPRIAAAGDRGASARRSGRRSRPRPASRR